jgi:hypothetical protein
MPATPQTARRNSFQLLAVRVDFVQIGDTIAQMEGWIRDRAQGHYIAVTGMKGVTENAARRAI